MNIVIDTNRIIAALIKDSMCRILLLNNRFRFYAPDYVLTEIRNHRRLILKKSGLDENGFELLLNILFERVEIMPKAVYEKNILKVKNEIKDRDDVPFLALAITIKADGIWTEDKHFGSQELVKIFSTKDILSFL